MSGPRIGIVGAGGDIGRRIAPALLRTGDEAVTPAQLLLAGRHPERIPVPSQGATEIDRCRLDVRDPVQLTRFAGALDVVVSAAGPSHDHALRAAAIVAGAGAHYVDVGGPADGRSVEGAEIDNRSALLYAGAVPGASGLVPRALLTTDPQSSTLRVISGGSGAFTRVGAEDYLAGLAHGGVEPLAAWREGRRTSRAAARQEQVHVPEFPDRVSLFPYLDADGEAIAREHGLHEATWYSAMVGEGVTDLLQLAAGMGLAEGSARLRDASIAMTAGTRPYMVLLAQTERCWMMLRAPGEAPLAAEVAAAAVHEILAGRAPTGAAALAAALDPLRMISAITGPGSPCSVVTSEGPGDSAMDEGAL